MGNISIPVVSDRAWKDESPGYGLLGAPHLQSGKAIIECRDPQQSGFFNALCWGSPSPNRPRIVLAHQEVDALSVEARIAEREAHLLSISVFFM